MDTQGRTPQQTREVVVGVDGSEASRRALDRGLRFGHAAGRVVRAVHVWQLPSPQTVGLDPGYLYDVAQATEDAEKAASELLEHEIQAALARRGGQGPVRVQAVSVEGVVGPTLVEQSAEAAVLVLGTRGHHRLVGMLGSATSHALHHGRCPVVVVPETVLDGQPFRKVVVGFDDSPSARAALAWAVDIAGADEAELRVVHAAPDGALREEREAWQQRVADCLPEGLAWRFSVVDRKPEAALPAAVGPQDLLVLGSRGTGTMRGLLLGSVSAHCVAHPTATVAVLPARVTDPDPLLVIDVTPGGVELTEPMDAG